MGINQNAARLPVQRYCRNCGRTVFFFDTNVRRHNANGKNIYRFAIYKCAKNHTWNEKLAIYKAFTDYVEVPDLADGETVEEAPALPVLPVLAYREQGVQEVQIFIESAAARYRLDKLLADQLDGWSRSQIVRKIKDGEIRVNQQRVKPGAILCANDRIVFSLG
ncbi:S4 domain-containing protein [Brevibacillus agri]|uniref:S4 domain-containing protein n=1 Tax=Brevibacillus agri TaxID=51101 RepID=UPI003D21745F